MRHSSIAYGLIERSIHNILSYHPHSKLRTNVTCCIIFLAHEVIYYYFCCFLFKRPNFPEIRLGRVLEGRSKTFGDCLFIYLFILLHGLYRTLSHSQSEESQVQLLMRDISYKFNALPVTQPTVSKR